MNHMIKLIVLRRMEKAFKTLHKQVFVEQNFIKDYFNRNKNLKLVLQQVHIQIFTKMKPKRKIIDQQQRS